jgi:hypothetical protein
MKHKVDLVKEIFAIVLVVVVVVVVDLVDVIVISLTVNFGLLRRYF